MFSWPLPNVVYLIILGVVLAYYLLVPLIILQTYRSNEDCDIIPWDPSETPPPKAISKFFEENEKILLEAGFREMGAFLLPNTMPNVQAVVRYYVHEVNRDSALASALFSFSPDGSLAIQITYTEFVTRFASDNPKLVQTSNPPFASNFAPLSNELTFRFPHIQNICKLYQFHQSLVKLHAPRERKCLTVLEKYDGDVSAYLADAVIRESYRDQETTGYLRYFPAERCWRATIKGAYLMTWKLLWPIKQIREAQVRRKAFRMERELEIM